MGSVATRCDAERQCRATCAFLDEDVGVHNVAAGDMRPGLPLVRHDKAMCQRIVELGLSWQGVCVGSRVAAGEKHSIFATRSGQALLLRWLHAGVDAPLLRSEEGRACIAPSSGVVQRLDFTDFSRPKSGDAWYLLPLAFRPPDSARVMAVAAGTSHCLLLTHDRRVWSWGSDRFGQLGLGGPASRLSAEEGGVAFHAVDLLAECNVAGVACGDDSSFALSVTGKKVWSWGRNAHNGALGLGALVEGCVTTPFEARRLRGLCVSDIAASHIFALALTPLGKVFSFGSAEVGGLGHGEMDVHTNMMNPKQIRALNDLHVIQIAIGSGQSAACLSENGRVLVWGNFGAFKFWSPREAQIPCSGTKAIAIAVGFDHMLALTGAGEVWCLTQRSELPSQVVPEILVMHQLSDTGLHGRVSEIACGGAMSICSGGEDGEEVSILAGVQQLQGRRGYTWFTSLPFPPPPVAIHLKSLLSDQLCDRNGSYF